MREEKANNKIISRKKISENLIIAIIIMLYLTFMNFAYARIDENSLLTALEISSLIILFLSIIIFEVAYHKDSGKLAINGIEILVLAFHTLTISYITTRINIEFNTYILFSTYSFVIYYVLKSILIYTKENRNYLKSLSDIHEIVSKEPVKKEAKKKEKAK